jgi:HEPN domain-containing protein
MNDETRAEAAAWLSKAGGDLRAAEILSAPENDQGAAAEKAVKALLVYRETPFPKTHDIERLLEMVN